MFVTKVFTFDAAHALTHYYGKCERLHGHTYRLEVTVEGPLDPRTGLVVDFALLKRVVKRHILNRLDHQNLNDHFENPSAELITQWIWEQLKDLSCLLEEEMKNPDFIKELGIYMENPDEALDGFNPNFKFLKLYEIQLWETVQNGVTYRG